MRLDSTPVFQVYRELRKNQDVRPGIGGMLHGLKDGLTSNRTRRDMGGSPVSGCTYLAVPLNVRAIREMRDPDFQRARLLSPQIGKCGIQDVLADSH